MDSSNAYPEHGYLVLADISGYEAFVTGTEFDHAQEIIGDLLAFLSNRLQPVLSLVQIEGDSLFTYTPESRITRGESLFELVEDTYGAFKSQLTTIKRRHTCTCAACQNVDGLDLKFFLHYGEYIEHSINDHHGLLGYAPMVVRKRGWKEAVAVAAGWQGYALFSEACLDKLNLKPDGLQAAMITDSPHKLFGLHLQARHEALLIARQIRVSPDGADATIRSELDAPPPVVWEWLNDPAKRNLWWEPFTRWTDRLRPGGRTGPGAVNHCDHGAGSMLETILDWRPFEYYTAEMRITPGRFDVLQTVYLEELSGGRTGILVCYRLKNQRLRWMARLVCGVVGGFLGLELRRLKRLLSN